METSKRLEMNILIAEKVMGYHSANVVDFDAVQYPAHFPFGGSRLTIYSEPGRVIGHFDPATSMDDAMKVIDKGDWFKPFCLAQHEGGWIVGGLNDSLDPWIISKAPTAALAICLAALKAVESMERTKT